MPRADNTASVREMREGLGPLWEEVPFSDGLVYRFAATFVKAGMTGYMMHRRDRKLPTFYVRVQDLVAEIDSLGMPTCLREVRHVD